MAMHPHPDGRTFVTAGGEERPSVIECLGHQLIRVTEVDRLRVERARWRQDDESGGASMTFDVIDESALGEEADRVKRHAERSGRRVVQCARVPRRKDIDALRAEVDRMRNRRVVCDSPVHQDTVTPSDRLEDAGDGCAGEDGVAQGAG
jgi:hypothetical protein